MLQRQSFFTKRRLASPFEHCPLEEKSGKRTPSMGREQRKLGVGYNSFVQMLELVSKTHLAMLTVYFLDPSSSATNAELWRPSKGRKCRPTSLEAHAGVSLGYKSFRCSEGTIHSIPPSLIPSSSLLFIIAVSPTAQSP